MQALEAAFLRAHERGWASVSFPAVSSGIFAVPLDVCARAYVRAVRGFFAAHPDTSLRRVRLCLLRRDRSWTREKGDGPAEWSRPLPGPSGGLTRSTRGQAGGARRQARSTRASRGSCSYQLADRPRPTPWPWRSVAGPRLTMPLLRRPLAVEAAHGAPDDEADRRSRQHVAQVVAVRLDARQADAGGEDVGGHADLPAVVVVGHGRQAERGRRVAGGERQAVAAVRARALDGVLQDAGVGAVDDHCLREVVRRRAEPTLRRETAGHEEGAHDRHDRAAAGRRPRAPAGRAGPLAAGPSSGSRTRRRWSWPRPRSRTAAGSGRRRRLRSCGRGSSEKRPSFGGRPSGSVEDAGESRALGAGGPSGGSPSWAWHGKAEQASTIAAATNAVPLGFFTRALLVPPLGRA